jgi:hypothetical protein
MGVMRNIVALSGGESSAAVAVLCKDLPDLILYFNDTKWEHPDLYRYLDDLSKYLGIRITEDSDGRTIEQLALENHIVPSNRFPYCSRILKGERMKAFAKPGDQLYFGIGTHEIHRAGRIRAIYSPMGINTHFPLIEKHMDAEDAKNIMAKTGIKRPALYSFGFEHNNCSGGCVRQGVRQWIHLLETFPGIYHAREALEEVITQTYGKPQHFMKDITLKELRKIYESQEKFDFGPEEWQGECIGMCGTMI